MRKALNHKRIQLDVQNNIYEINVGKLIELYAIKRKYE